MYFLKTRTTWQKAPTDVKLENIKEAMPSHPLIEQKFFDDLIENCRLHENYFVEMGLLGVANEEKKLINPDFWILIWAVDFKDRLFQLLIERHPTHEGKGAVVAVGPGDLLEFFASMKKNGVLPLLTLINSPEKMKTVGVVVSRPKTYQQNAKEKQQLQAFGRFKSWVDQLKMAPNKEGRWFPGNYPKCPMPECEAPLVGVQDTKDPTMGILICPGCGYTERKKIAASKDPFKWPF